MTTDGIGPYSTIAYAVEQGVGHISLHRDDGLNAINYRMTVELLDVSIRSSEDPGVRAILIDGDGPNFCGGGDLDTISAAIDQLPALFRRQTASFNAAISNFARGAVPVVVAVHGNVIGGATALLGAGDLVLAAESTKFRLAFTSLGLTPDGGASFFLPRLVGERRALDLVLTNRRFGADEAERWGLVTRQVDDSELRAESMALAGQLAAGPSLAYGRARNLVRDAWDNTLETHMRLETEVIAALAQSDDAREGIRAFLEKRKPAFGDPGGLHSSTRNEVTR
jgi:2-(1,2-epoxy-1,2-dihydrophenyl)acetyl-CoA isomerase